MYSLIVEENVLFTLKEKLIISFLYNNKILDDQIKPIKDKAIAMMRRKSPRSENIYLIENHCQANISK